MTNEQLDRFAASLRKTCEFTSVAAAQILSALARAAEAAKEPEHSDDCSQFVDVEKLADTRASAEAEGESE